MTETGNEMISILPTLESGMDFVRSAQDTAFCIESSSLYKNRKQNVKMAEFLLLKRSKKSNTIWIIEAKPRIGQDGASDITDQPATRSIAQEFATEVNEKLFNALALTLIGIAGKCTPDQSQEIPVEFRNIDWGKANLRFLLVVKECPDNMVSKFSAGLSEACSRASKSNLPYRSVQRMLGITNPKISVLNEKQARKYEFIR